VSQRAAEADEKLESSAGLERREELLSPFLLLKRIFLHIYKSHGRQGSPFHHYGKKPLSSDKHIVLQGLDYLRRRVFK
jgi:hypothetical protein